MARSDRAPASARAPDRPPARRATLRPRPRRTSYRRNPFVGIMKVLLPMLALALLMLVVAWPQLIPKDDSFRLQIAAVGPSGAGRPIVLNPRVVGVDDRTQPFQITANLGTRIRGADGQEYYRLEQPKADITTTAGHWVAVTANEGHFDDAAQLLFLEGDVNLFHDNGSEFLTSAATVNLELRTASGEVPIAGQGPTGLVEAEGFRLFDRGDRIIFTGRARVTIFGRPSP